MSKILMGLRSKNDNVKLTEDFLKDEEYIQLNLKNENLACIFPTRTGINRIFKDVILQEDNKNIIVFDVNSSLLNKTAPQKLYNGYEIVCISDNQTDKEKEEAITNIIKSKKFVIYLDMRKKDILKFGEKPILKFLFDKVKDFNLLTIIDETQALLNTGMLFLKELSECKNNQIIFRFQDEGQFSLKAYSEVEIKKMKVAGLNIEILSNFYKKINILEIPNKMEQEGNKNVKVLLLDKYSFKNNKTGKSLMLTAPNIYEVTKYLERY